MSRQTKAHARRQPGALTWILGGVASLGLAAAAPPALADPAALGPLTQISGGTAFANCDADDVPGQEAEGSVVYPNSEIEPYIDVNPTNPNNIIAVWQQDRWSDGGSRGLVAGVSNDGGETWKDVVIPGLTLCGGGLFERASDPWVSFGPAGKAYFIGLPFDSDPNIFGGNHAVTVNVSTDGGQTWSAPKALIAENDPDVFNDKESITADPNNANLAYATWDRLENFVPAAAQQQALAQGLRFERDKIIMAGRLLRQMRADAAAAAAAPPQFKGPTLFTRTRNGGDSWELARVIYDPGADNQTINNVVLVQPDGTVIVIFTEILNLPNGTTRANISLKRSVDQGFSFLPTKGVKVAQRISTLAIANPVGTFTPDDNLPVRDAGILFDSAVDPKTGRLYLVWQDNRFSNGLVDQIAFSMSRNGGQTWTKPIKISQTPDLANDKREAAFVPTIAVTADGRLAVTYYDFRNDDGSGELVDQFVVFCDGRTRDCSKQRNWAREARLTDESFDILDAPTVGAGEFLGDYMGLATAGSDAIPAFGIADGLEETSIYTRTATPSSSIAATAP